MAAKSFVRLPLVNGKTVLVKHSTIQLVHHDQPCELGQCFVSTTNKKKSLHKVDLTVDQVEELLG